MQKPLKQEVVEWKQSKVTKYLLQYIDDEVKSMQELWAAGGYTMESQSGTIQLNSQAIGSIKGLGQLLDFLESDMDAEEAEAKYEH